MSLYGNIKRIDDSVFKFDRIYTSRAEMDEKTSSDGVYIGRYVLVEYGERYFSKPTSTPGQYEQVERSINNLNVANPEEIGSLKEGVDYIVTSDVEPVAKKRYYTKSLENTLLIGAPYIGAEEADPNDDRIISSFDPDVTYYEFPGLYAERAAADIEKYHSTFDSTVWLKIYTGGTEKYIMVAELNALIPHLKLAPIKTLKYKNIDNADEVNLAEEAYDVNNEKIVGGTQYGIKSEFVDPYFSRLQDTELTYEMFVPKPLELNVNDNTLKFDRNGFNIVYSEREVIDSDNPQGQENYIHWVPDGLDKNFVNETEIGSKTLYMNLPAFGKAIHDLYDLLYGAPTYGEGEFDGVRPFFIDDWNKANDVYKTDHDGENLNRDNDKLDWLSQVDIGNLLGNNTTGLAGILSHIFTLRNPFTGEVYYYLRAAWDTLDDGNSNIPAIEGKPKVVTTSTRNPIGAEDISVPTYDGHYSINYDAWVLSTNS